MAGSIRRTFVWHFDCPVDAIWPVLADTARFNEAAGLARQEIEEIPQSDGSVRFLARARSGPFKLLCDYITTSQEVDVIAIRPLTPARWATCCASLGNELGVRALGFLNLLLAASGIFRRPLVLFRSNL